MKRLSTAWLMAPRWGWGRKLIGTDAKTSAEIANHPPPALESCQRTALPPELNTPPPPRCAGPCPSHRRWMRSRRLGAFRSRAGPRGASRPPSRLLLITHTWRPPALTGRVAPYPCRASLQGTGGVCFQAGCSSVCAAHSVGLELSRSRFPGARGWAGSRARCWLLFARL